MAKQHFYSRVPARASMFNKADSFDTFACSKGVDEQFISKELNFICDAKLTSYELEQVRLGKLTPVYNQFTTKSGQLVQSTTSYIQKDYTGERSSYLVHSAIYEGDEIPTVLEHADNIIFNDNLFVKDSEKLAIGAPDMKVEDEYPEIEYKTSEFSGDWQILNNISKPTQRRLIYAILMCFDGKLKSIFYRLPEEAYSGNDSSLYALRFTNEVMQILPYFMRADFSFSTRVIDVNKFPAIKFKHLPKPEAEIPAGKGAFVDLLTDSATGISDETVAQNLYVVNFFRELIKSESVRREFLRFSDFAAKNSKYFSQSSYKNIKDLIFVFRVASGLYDTDKELPDVDLVTEFFSIYEKNRDAFPDEYKINAVKVLDRYPQAHTAIPKTVFSKIAKIYPKEIPACRRIIMNSMLEFIHTDVMRDKLFSFIAANYPDEDEERKEDIVEHLCRVFYGGFLQKQILEFFGEHFSEFSDNLKVSVCEKIYSQVRTPEIQNGILAFIENCYASFDEMCKKLFYQTACDYIKAGDEVSSKLIDLCDKIAETEAEDAQNFYVEGIKKLLDSEKRKKTKPLTEMLAAKNGFTAKLLSDLALDSLGDGGNDAFFDNAFSGSFTERIEKVKYFEQKVEKEQFETIFDKFIQSFAQNKPSATVYEVLNSAKTFSKQSQNERFVSEVLSGYVKSCEAEAYKLAATDFDLPRKFYEFAQGFEGEEENLKTLKNFIDLRDALKGGDKSLAIEPLEGFIEQKNVKTILTAIEKSFGKEPEVANTFLYAFAVDMLKNKKTSADVLLAVCEKNDIASLTDVLNFYGEITLLSEKLSGYIVMSSSGIGAAISKQFNTLDRKMAIDLSKNIQAQITGTDAYKTFVDAAFMQAIPEKKSIFSIFKKK